MFASPINFELLSHREEYRLIKDSILSSKKQIIVNKVHGTRENFNRILEEQRPGAIHFSGTAVE